MASKKKTPKKTATKKKTGKKQTKADFIRARAGKSPKEILADAKKAGISMSAAQVYSQRTADKKKGKTKPKGRAKAKAPAAAKRRTTRRAASPGSGDAALREAIARIGIDRARAILNEVEQAILGR